MINRFALPLAAALAVMAGWSWTMQQRGVDKERNRVEAAGKRTSARAKAARSQTEARVRSSNNVLVDLKEWCRDCD